MHTIVTIFSLVTVVLGAQLPPGIPRCRVSDSDCLKSSANKAFVIFADGNKQLGVPPLDPVFLSKFVIEQQPGPISLYQEFTDVKIVGFLKAKVQQLTINLDDCFIHVEMSLPNFEGESLYVFKGQMMTFPIDTAGDFRFKCKGFSINANSTCEVIHKQNGKYLRITSTAILIGTNSVEFSFGPLIPGNEQLDKEVHKVVDDEPFAFFEVVRPAVQNMWGNFLNDVLNNVFMKISLDDLFIK